MKVIIRPHVIMVIPSGSYWKVRKYGSKRAIRRFKTRGESVNYAIKNYADKYPIHIILNSKMKGDYLLNINVVK